MAIFGKLADFSLREILSVIGGRSGNLLIENDGGHRLRVHLSGGRITHVSFERALDSSQEISLLLKRLGDGQGSFHFDNDADNASSTGSLALSWEELLLSSESTAQSEALSDALPHPQTRFMLIKGRTVQLPAPLNDFLLRSSHFLERGTSAEQLSKKLGIPLETVQLQLMQLREVKKIWPVRAYAEPSNASRTHVNNSLAKRLLGLFLK